MSSIISMRYKLKFEYISVDNGRTSTAYKSANISISQGSYDASIGGYSFKLGTMFRGDD